MSSVFDGANGERGKRSLRYPALLEIFILGVLAVVLMIGLAVIRSLVSERSDRARTAREEIAASWGQSQTIGGPVVVVPFRVHSHDAQGKPFVSINRARFLPDRLQVKGRLVPERRHRGIFETVLYRAHLTIDGEFAPSDFSGWNVQPEDVMWEQAIVTFGVSDLRGVQGTPVLKWGGRALPLSGGSGDPKLWVSGLTVANVFASGAETARVPFSLDLVLNGSEQIGFYPFGRQTRVEITSPWPDPNFNGAYLPESRSITPQGFSARWEISALARSYPQRWREWGDETNTAVFDAIRPSVFNVGLYSPVGHYQKTDRSMKYGALFIILTFLTFFLYELLSPVTLHPVQYFLVGGALCLFYLLLLSISEHAPFSISYLIASVATVALITSYSAALLQSRMRVFGLAGVLSLLYGYLYVLLQLEDWALLMGSVGLFLILGLVMYATRRVDWGAAHLGRARATEV